MSSTEIEFEPVTYINHIYITSFVLNNDSKGNYIHIFQTQEDTILLRKDTKYNIYGFGDNVDAVKALYYIFNNHLSNEK